MARKLKTYQISLGFFDLAIAALSMKAALEAWGAGSNLFHQGVAKESGDPEGCRCGYVETWRRSQASRGIRRAVPEITPTCPMGPLEPVVLPPVNSSSASSDNRYAIHPRSPRQTCPLSFQA